MDAEPGTLKPAAIAVIEILRRARGRTLTVRTLVRRLLQDTPRAHAVIILMLDMAELGLVERVTIGTYRLLVEGPARRSS